MIDKQNETYSLNNIESINAFQKEHEISILFLSSHDCNVCISVKYQLNEMLKKYPEIPVGQVYIDDVELAKGKFTVFTVPTLLLLVEGKEVNRFSRIINFSELEKLIARYYEVFYANRM